PREHLLAVLAVQAHHPVRGFQAELDQDGDGRARSHLPRRRSPHAVRHEEHVPRHLMAVGHGPGRHVGHQGPHPPLDAGDQETVVVVGPGQPGMGQGSQLDLDHGDHAPKANKRGGRPTIGPWCHAGPVENGVTLRPVKRPGWILLFAAAAACSRAPAPQFAWDTSASFAAVRRYAWYDGPPFQYPSGSSIVDGKFVDQHVRREVDAEMARKGYVKTDAGTPDVYVTYTTSPEGVADRDVWGQYSWWSPFVP